MIHITRLQYRVIYIHSKQTIEIAISTEDCANFPRVGIYLISVYTLLRRKGTQAPSDLDVTVCVYVYKFYEATSYS